MSEAESGERWTFVIEALDAPDQLLRVLNLFVVIGAWPSATSLERSACGVTIRITAEGLNRRRADTLCNRLQALPGATAVGVVWRAGSAQNAARPNSACGA